MCPSGDGGARCKAAGATAIGDGGWCNEKPDIGALELQITGVVVCCPEFGIPSSCYAKNVFRYNKKKSTYCTIRTRYNLSLSLSLYRYHLFPATHRIAIDVVAIGGLPAAAAAAALPTVEAIERTRRISRPPGGGGRHPGNVWGRRRRIRCTPPPPPSLPRPSLSLPPTWYRRKSSLSAAAVGSLAPDGGSGGAAWRAAARIHALVGRLKGGRGRGAIDKRIPNNYYRRTHLFWFISYDTKVTSAANEMAIRTRC